MSDSENEQLLNILEAHGQAFLNSFGPLDAINSFKKKKSLGGSYCSQDKPEEEEWHGICLDVASEGPKCEEETDTEADSDSNNVVVFSDVGLRKTTRVRMKAFMSSNISRLKTLGTQSDQNIRQNSIEEGDDLTNAQNDALLHKLIHTKLLPASLNTDLNLPPGKKQKALTGRIMELSGQVKIGKGERRTRETERNKAAKRVREGIIRKQRERGKQRLEEAKNLGNYHPTLKRVFEVSSPSVSRRREKGLKMGVGNFSNGFLHLSKDDVSMVTGDISRPRDRGPGHPKRHRTR